MQATFSAWPRYRLRTLLLLVLVVSVAGCWIGGTKRKAERQREAREALQSRHWGVVHEFRHDSDFWLIPPKPAGPAWLRRFLGVDFFNDVTWVRTPAPEYGAPVDADFECLKSFPNLQRLDLGHDATDRVLARLQGMKNLKWLEMKDGKVTDAGLKNLEQSKGLRVLLLSGTQITDEGLTHLQCLSQLRSLDLARTKITDTGVQQLVTLRELHSLDLSGTQTTDAALDHLRNFASTQPNLFLYLNDTLVTDQGIYKLLEAAPMWTILPHRVQDHPAMDSGETEED